MPIYNKYLYDQDFSAIVYDKIFIGNQPCQMKQESSVSERLFPLLENENFLSQISSFTQVWCSGRIKKWLKNV